ncbi:MAG: UbiA family prenyltransferase [Crocinitomicaceae bacterium]|nr:UbiA family prenyltransferase [Crocinitomicaceae bacterium]
MKSYIKLIRPLNLFIVYLTMTGIRHYIIHSNGEQYFWEMNFSLLLLSMLLLVAGGNVINDYFDIEADKINKPQKVIVGQTLSKSKTMFFYLVLNALSFLLAVYLCWALGTFVFLLTHLLLMLLLYLYSYYFKRSLIVGNFFVAILTTMAVIIVVIFMDYDTLNYSYPMGVFDEKLNSTVEFVVWGFAALAFLQNLPRELVKDIADIPGDKKINATTLPVVYGEKLAFQLVGLLALVYPILFGYLYVVRSMTFDVQLIPFFIGVVMNVIIFILAFSPKAKKTLKFISTLLKVSMLIGLLYLYLPR